MFKIGIVMRGIVYILSLSGITIIGLLPADKYEWAREMDPSAAIYADPGFSGSAWIAATVLLLLVLAAQLWIAIAAANTKGRLAPAIVGLLAIVVWGVNFWT